MFFEFPCEENRPDKLSLCVKVEAWIDSVIPTPPAQSEAGHPHHPIENVDLWELVPRAAVFPKYDQSQI